MLACENYHKIKNRYVPCGCCPACKERKFKEWKSRLACERRRLKVGCVYVCLTYNEDKLPENRSLVKQHASDFYKRLRSRCDPSLVKDMKMMLVGEYGEEHNRPHYHFCIFGYPISLDFYRDISESWHDESGQSYGRVDIRRPYTLSRVAGYITDYLTKDQGFYNRLPGETVDDYVKRTGRRPPFFECSPGIGLEYLQENFEKIKRDGLVIDGRKYTMPRYFRRKILDSASEEESIRHFKDVRNYYVSLCRNDSLDVAVDLLYSVDSDLCGRYLWHKRRYDSLYRRCYSSIVQRLRAWRDVPILSREALDFDLGKIKKFVRRTIKDKMNSYIMYGSESMLLCDVFDKRFEHCVRMSLFDDVIEVDEHSHLEEKINVRLFAKMLASDVCSWLIPEDKWYLRKHECEFFRNMQLWENCLLSIYEQNMDLISVKCFEIRKERDRRASIRRARKNRGMFNVACAV